ncbi:hypothetical protein [Hydrocarboniphaga sp.]|uniref:hypothetical protein n=1 Tax=Hydrocarboniphaga sp. TaxID=2033016 RepID=UPI003D0E006F
MTTLPSYWITHPSCRLHRMEASEASVASLLRVHGADHVEAVLRTRPAEGLIHIDPDTSMNAHTATAALHAAGAGRSCFESNVAVSRMPVVEGEHL